MFYLVSRQSQVCTTMSATADIDGSLYVEISKLWEEMYCCINGRKFQAFRKIRQNIEASRSNRAELAVEVCYVDCTTQKSTNFFEV